MAKKKVKKISKKKQVVGQLGKKKEAGTNYTVGVDNYHKI